MNASWKTTLFGAGGLVSVLAGALQHWAAGQPVDWNLVIAAALPAIGLIFARDNDITSKQAGAEN